MAKGRNRGTVTLQGGDGGGHGNGGQGFKTLKMYFMPHRNFCYKNIDIDILYM